MDQQCNKLLVGIFVSFIFCLCVQSYMFYVCDTGTGKSESNYFSTLSRFQAGATPSAHIALAGSSITGRLPGRESGNSTIANLGSDGGHALDGLRLIAMGVIDMPQWLVIEANTLYGGVGFGDTLIVKGAQSPWFDVGVRLPLLGASARPSAMLYSKLLRRPKVLDAEAFIVKSDTVDLNPIISLSDISDGEQQRFDEYVALIKKMSECGVNILIVNYPAGVMKEHDYNIMHTTIAEFSKRFPISYIDISSQVPRSKLSFTDSVHLSPESAAKILSTIQNFCKTQNTNTIK